MKFRKVLSLFAAAAMTVSCFTGLATTANAAEKTEGFFISDTYTDTSATVANGTELFAEEGFVTMTTYGDAAAVKKDANSPDEWGDYAIQFRLGKNYTGDVSNDIQSGCAGVIVEPEVDGTCSVYVRRGAGKNAVLSDGKTVTEKVQEGTEGNFYEVVDFDMTAGTTYCVYSRGGTSYLYGITYTAETDAPAEPEEPKESVVYTWDFTNSTFFASEIAKGSTILSDQKESPAIMSNPGLKFSYDNTSVKDADVSQSAKVNGSNEQAIKLVIPDGGKATLSIQLTSSSSGKTAHLKHSDGTVIFTTTDYTKGYFKTYTCDLVCGETYYLDTSESGSVFAGKVVLTVYPVVDDTEEPTPELTLPTVAVSELSERTEASGKEAKSFLGTFTVDPETNYSVSGITWTVGTATGSTNFDTVIAEGTVVTGLIVLADDLAAIPVPTAETIAAPSAE